MITKIGTPASQRMMSRNIGRYPLGNRRATTATEREARGDRCIPVLAAARCRPPSRRQRENQCRCSDESGKDCRMAGLVGGRLYGVYGVVDAPLGLLLRNAGASGDNLRKIRAIAGVGTSGDPTREYP